MLKKITALISVLMFTSTAFASVKLQITGGYFEPITIVVNNPDYNNSKAKVYAKRIKNIINHDLIFSSLFTTLSEPENVNIKDINDLSVSPNFAWWTSNLSTQLMLQSKIEANNKYISISFRLWDMELQKQLKAKKYIVKTKNWRRLAHIISDSIYNITTSEKGFFDTRILFIDEKKNIKTHKRTKRLAIMDYDGANLKYLTSGKYMVLTPKFAPNGKWATYMSYQQKVPQLYLINLQTGKTRPLKIRGNQMTFAANFSSNSKSLIYTVEKKGNSNIFLTNLETGKTKKLTNSRSINVSPSISPDNRYVIFSSDRTGRQEIYKLDLKTRSLTKISHMGGNYANPVYSPRGDILAFTKIQDGTFFIGIMDTDGNNEKLLTSGYLVENPSWASSGRNLIYTKEEIINHKKRTHIYSIDITGINERKLRTPNEASDASWSPLLDNE